MDDPTLNGDVNTVAPFISLPNGDYVRKNFVAAVLKEPSDGEWLVIVELGSNSFNGFVQSVSRHANEAAANAAMHDLRVALEA